MLGVKAEPPDAPPGAQIALSALVADPLGEGRPVTWSWAICTPDPVLGVSSCAEEGRSVPLGLGTSMQLAIPANALDGLTPEVQARGIDAFVVLVVDAPETVGEGAATEIAYKRVRISTAPAPNTNPVLDEVRVHGAPEGDVEARDGDLLPLAATVGSGSIQSFVSSLGETETEELKYSWFATSGRFERGLTFGEPGTGETENDWHVPDDVEPTDLWLVVRDPRGGLDWRQRRIVPSP